MFSRRTEILNEKEVKEETTKLNSKAPHPFQAAFIPIK